MLQKITDTYVLSNGVKIPCVGFGTWKAENGEVARKSVLAALEAGYRHVDTAAAYHNEESVGTALVESGIPREELFVTSKLMNRVRGYDSTLRAFEDSVRKLKTDYLDLYLIHWPNPIYYRDHWQQANTETWKAFEKLYNDGRIRAIGISNFLPHHIEALLQTAEVAPHVNQIRLCPGSINQETVDYCRKHDILLEAYSPLGSGEIFHVPEMNAFAEKYGKSIGQICLRFSLQMGFLPLPKSVTPARIIENTEIFDFELEQADIDAIAALTNCCGPTPDPDTAPY